MNAKRLRILLVSLTAYLLCFLPLAVAGKPNKPGGGGNVPGGTVYFHHDGDVWTMNSDGSNRVRLPLVTAGDWSFAARRAHPSHAVHANDRWFVRIAPVGGQYPDEEIRVISQSGTSITLVTAAEADILSPPIWMSDDQSVSFIGQRWQLDESGQPLWIADAGLYTVDVAYDNSDALAGAVPGSLTLRADLSDELRIDPLEGFSASGGWGGHSWSPDGSTFTFGVRISEGSPQVQEIWIVDLLQVSDPYNVPAQSLMLLDNGNGIGWPEWSPDGKKIGYVSWDGAVIYDLANHRSKTLKRTPNDSWGSVDWSPDASHFVVAHWDNFSGYDGIFRFTSTLSGKMELTAGLCPPDANFDCVLDPMGWRN